MVTFTVELPDTVSVELGKDSGIFTVVPVKDFPESTIRFAVINGFQGALNNISRGTDDDGKANSDDAWLALRTKRMTPWFEGSAWASTTRENVSSGVKDAFMADFMDKTGLDSKRADVYLKAKVVSAFGKDAKATLGNILESIALEKEKAKALPKGMSRESYVDGLYEQYRKAAAEKANAAKVVVAELDISSIEF